MPPAIRNRPGMTLVEIVISFLLGTLLMIVAYNIILLVRSGQQKTDNVSTKTIAELQLMETLMLDLRSAEKVTEDTPGTKYTIHRYVSTSGKLDSKEITYTVEADGKKVVRREGSSAKEFDFGTIMDPKELPFKFRITPMDDAKFFGKTTP